MQAIDVDGPDLNRIETRRIVINGDVLANLVVERSTARAFQPPLTHYLPRGVFSPTMPAILYRVVSFVCAVLPSAPASGGTGR